VSDERDQITRSFRPGEWFGIFGEHATVLLPPSEKARVAALWEIVDDGAGFDETLDALIATGLRDLPGFVLVSETGGETKVVIRGDARAGFATQDGPVDLDGATATTWVERSLRGVTRMTVEVGQESGSSDLRLAGGLVRLSRVDQPPRADHAEDGEPLVTEPVVAEPEIEEPVVDEPPIWVPTPPPPPFGAPVNPPPVGGATDEDHDGTTRAGDWDSSLFERQQPGIPGQPPAPSVTARPVARLVFSSGETVDVDRAVLVGRAPEARRFTSDEQPRLVTVPSPNQEISSTHLEVRPGSGADHGSAVVTDMGSTNGTVLVQPGLPPEDLQPGIAVQLIPGAVIDLGEGVTVQVTNP